MLSNIRVRLKLSDFINTDKENEIIKNAIIFLLDRLLKKDSNWSTLKAFKNKKLFVADGNQFFNRPGPRLIESLEILAEIIHPNVYQFNHEQTGWIKYKNNILSMDFQHPWLLLLLILIPIIFAELKSLFLCCDDLKILPL